MLKRSTLIFLLSGAALLTNAVIAAQSSAPLTNCISKRQDLKDKTEQVRTFDDTARLSDTQQELDKIEQHCAKLGSNSAHGAQVSKAQSNVRDSEKHLIAALGAGNADSISANQKRLSKARKTLEQVETQARSS